MMTEELTEALGWRLTIDLSLILKDNTYNFGAVGH